MCSWPHNLSFLAKFNPCSTVLQILLEKERKARACLSCRLPAVGFLVTQQWRPFLFHSPKLYKPLQSPIVHISLEIIVSLGFFFFFFFLSGNEKQNKDDYNMHQKKEEKQRSSKPRQGTGRIISALWSPTAATEQELVCSSHVTGKIYVRSKVLFHTVFNGHGRFTYFYVVA